MGGVPPQTSLLTLAEQTERDAQPGPAAFLLIRHPLAEAQVDGVGRVAARRKLVQQLGEDSDLVVVGALVAEGDAHAVLEDGGDADRGAVLQLADALAEKARRLFEDAPGEGDGVRVDAVAGPHDAVGVRLDDAGGGAVRRAAAEDVALGADGVVMAAAGPEGDGLALPDVNGDALGPAAAEGDGPHLGGGPPGR